ncbi:MAG: OmpA family protein [Saprospiraceae bacterium]|nr:OmpA family protein [Saprospiraceae bacterium]
MKALSSIFLALVCIGQLVAQSPMPATKTAKSGEVYFDFGKHDLRPAADSVLAQLVGFTKGKENFSIRITAHTDSIGSLSNNLALSERRANAVKGFLVKNGVADSLISFAYFGEKTPATFNATEEGRQRNRRATVEVLLTVPMITIEGQVTDAVTGLPLLADVIFRSKNMVDSVKTGEDGRFKTVVPVGTVLGIDAFANCHFMKSEMVKADKKVKPLAMPLKPASKGAIADIDNLYFEGNLPILLEKSKPELPKILRFMQANPAMKIEIAGHVNRPNAPPVSRTSADFVLSENRAKVVYKYLLENGIPESRISWKGYGNHEMVSPYAIHEVDQARNRRVELRVLEGCE